MEATRQNETWMPSVRLLTADVDGRRLFEDHASGGKDDRPGLTRALSFRRGYSKEQMMELLLRVAMKTINNYLDHINPAPIDAAFEANASEQPAE